MSRLADTPAVVQGSAWLNNNNEIEDASTSLLSGGWRQLGLVQAGLARQRGMTQKRL